VILTDDNFAAIVTAVEEGRAIFRNIRKFVTYILASNVPEIMPFVMTAMFDLPLALTVAQILAIDLGTDLLPSLALGTEKPEPDVMKSPPRRRDQELVNGRLVSRAVWLGMIETVLCYAGFIAVYVLSGNLEPVHLESLNWITLRENLHLAADSAPIWARTVFFAGVVTAQVGNAFACRRERPGVHELGWFSNHYLMVGVVIQLALALILIYFEPLAALFDMVALPPLLWLGLIANAPVLYGIERLRKILALRLPAPAEPQLPEGVTASH
jgi:P-type Ca2+ transporter type 2C